MISAREVGGAVRFQFSAWVVVAVVGFVAVVLRVWWYCRVWHIRVHLFFLVLVGIPISFLPAFVENYILVDDDHVEWGGQSDAGTVR